MMISIQASPFVPGRAQGLLRIGAAIEPGCIVLLRQSEIEALKAQPAGIILTDAAPLSHPVLRLLSRGIPTILAEAKQLTELRDGMEVLLDGHKGLLVSPVPRELAAFVSPARPQAGKCADGVAVELRASVGDVAQAAAARDQGAAAIGLVRTEYLFPADGGQPDACHLAAAFEQVCHAADPLSVTFRLIDVAGDKRPPWLAGIPGIAGILGLQGARLYSIEPVRSVYLAEVEALSQLAARFPIKVLLPYIVAVEELEALVAEVRQYLPHHVPLGAMLETPAAAIALQEFLEIADFVALGCNDLMQCLFAADRDMPALRAWLNPYAPALYRFLDDVARRAGSATADVQVCGLLSQLPGVLPVLVGLGYRRFSVDPVMLPWLAATVRQIDTATATQLAKTVCEAKRLDTVRKLLT